MKKALLLGALALGIYAGISATPAHADKIDDKIAQAEADLAKYQASLEEAREELRNVDAGNPLAEGRREAAKKKIHRWQKLVTEKENLLAELRAMKKSGKKEKKPPRVAPNCEDLQAHQKYCAEAKKLCRKTKSVKVCNSEYACCVALCAGDTVPPGCVKP